MFWYEKVEKIFLNYFNLFINFFYVLFMNKEYVMLWFYVILNIMKIEININ